MLVKGLKESIISTKKSRFLDGFPGKECFIISDATTDTIEDNEYIKKCDFTMLLVHADNLSELINSNQIQDIYPIHDLVTAKLTSRYEYLSSNVFETIYFSEYKSSFFYSNFEAEIVFDYLYRPNETTPRIIPCPLDFEESEEFNRKVSLYLTLYFMKHEGIKEPSIFFKNKLAIMNKSKGHAYYVFIVAKDRLLSEAYLATKYILKYHYVIPDAIVNYSYDEYYYSFILTLEAQFDVDEMVVQSLKRVPLTLAKSEKAEERKVSKIQVTEADKSRDISSPAHRESVSEFSILHLGNRSAMDKAGFYADDDDGNDADDDAPDTDDDADDDADDDEDEADDVHNDTVYDACDIGYGNDKEKGYSSFMMEYL